MRGDEGYLLALAYSTQRGYGRNHPFAAEIRSGYVALETVPEELGFAVNVGELLMTECEMVNGFVAPDNDAPHFTRGYGLVFDERTQSDGNGAGGQSPTGTRLR